MVENLFNYLEVYNLIIFLGKSSIRRHFFMKKCRRMRTTCFFMGESHKKDDRIRLKIYQTAQLKSVP